MPPRDAHNDWVQSTLGLDPGHRKYGGDGRGGGKHGADAGAARRLKKAGAVWHATRAKVDSEIQKLRKGIMALDHGGEFGDSLEQAFQSAVAPILSTLDHSLAHMMEAAAHASDPEAAKTLKAEAHKTIGRYMKFVSSNEVISSLDKNPFVKVSIGKTLEASLSTIASSIR